MTDEPREVILFDSGMEKTFKSNNYHSLDDVMVQMKAFAQKRGYEPKQIPHLTSHDPVAQKIMDFYTCMYENGYQDLKQVMELMIQSQGECRHHTKNSYYKIINEQKQEYITECKDCRTVLERRSEPNFIAFFDSYNKAPLRQ